MRDTTKARYDMFVEQYIIDHNATQAAIRSGYSPKYARTTAAKLVKNDYIKQKIKEKEKQLTQSLNITQKKIIEELARIAFTDVSDFLEVVNINGRSKLKIKDFSQFEKGFTKCISSIKNGDRGIEIKFYDKVKALELLSSMVDTDSEKYDKLDAVLSKIGGKI